MTPTAAIYQLMPSNPCLETLVVKVTTVGTFIDISPHISLRATGRDLYMYSPSCCIELCVLLQCVHLYHCIQGELILLLMCCCWHLPCNLLAADLADVVWHLLGLLRYVMGMWGKNKPQTLHR